MAIKILFMLSMMIFRIPHLEDSPDPKNRENITQAKQTTNATDHFRSKQSGAWNEHSTWESSPDNINWSQATSKPTYEAKTTTIENGHIVNITSTESSGILVVKQGATLEQDAESDFHIMPVEPQLSFISFEIHGLFILNGRSPELSPEASARVFEGGMVQVDGNNNGISEASYSPSEAFGYCNQVFWDKDAVFEWNTTETFRLSGSILYFPNADPDDVAIFRINKDLINPGTGSNGINGLLEVNSTAILGSGASNMDKTFRDGICGSGKIVAGSPAVRFRIDGKNPILGGTDLKVHSERKISLVTDVIIPEDSIVIITGEGIDNNRSGQKLTVNGILDMTDQQFTNTNGTIEVSSTGILRTSRNQGFSGTATTIPSGNISLQAGSTIDFYGDAQAVNNRTDYKNIVISGSGIKTPISSFSPNGTITIKDDAVFDCSLHNIGGIETSLTMTGGRLILGTNGLQPTMEGAYNLTGGVVEFANSNPGQIGQTIRTETYKNIEITGNNVANSSGRIQILPEGSFVIKENGIYTSSSGNAPIIATESDQISRTLKIEPGGKFITNVARGFYGKRVSGQSNSYTSVDSTINNINFAPGSTIEYGRNQNNEQTISHSGRFIYQNLILSGSGQKVMPPRVDMEIKGNFISTDDASFDPNQSTVSFTGTSPQIIASDGNEIEFYNLVIDNGLTDEDGATVIIGSEGMTEDISTSNILALKENSKLELNTADLVIKSTKENTARVEAIPQSACIFYNETSNSGGHFRIERFINDHFKAWQLLASNALGGTIFESWQNKKANIAGRGIQITDPKYTTTNGFDSYSPSPSMKYWDIESQTYVGIGSTFEEISNHSGYMVFVRGDRSVTTIDDNNHPATTIHIRGKLYTPHNTPTPVIVPGGKFAIVGNPYASAIKYNKLNISGAADPDKDHPLSGGYYIWNPRIESGRSQYQYGNGLFQRVQIIPGFGATPVPSPLGSDATEHIIHSGQAVFVYNSGDEGTINFSESAKEDGSNSEFFRPMGEKNNGTPSLIRTNLAAGGEGNVILDGTLQIFGTEYSHEVDEFDARKMVNDGENISLSSPLYPLVVERRSWPQDNDTVFYNLSKLKKQAYTLQLGLYDINSQKVKVSLNDDYTKNVIPLEDGFTYYDFMVDNRAASSDQNRFYLTFSNYRSISSNFYFFDEMAMENNGSVDISWAGFNQNGVDEYIIEHSDNQSDFISIYSAQASENSDGYYNFRHKTPEEGTNYYRIKATGIEGKPIFSKVVNARILPSESSIEIYPNPAKANIWIKMVHKTPGKYRLRLADAAGRIVRSQYIVNNGNRSISQIQTGNLSSGIYQLEIIDENGNNETFQVAIAK